MQWKLFADIAERAGTDEVRVDLADDDPTVGDALDALFEAHPDLRERVLADGGSEARDGVAPDVNVLLDGADVFVTGDGLATGIEEGAELALFPPVSGG